MKTKFLRLSINNLALLRCFKLDREKAPFFKERSSIQEIFPDIEEIDLYIKSTNLVGEIKAEYHFQDLKSMPSHVRCGNPDCRDGGYNIVLDIILPVYRKRETEKEGSIICKGYEKIGKGTRSCSHIARYKLRIKYKSLK